MYIEKIDVASFASFPAVSLSFTDTINLLSLSHSYIYSALVFAFFGFLPSEKEEYLTADTPTAEVSVTLNLNGEQYTVFRKEKYDKSFEPFALITDKEAKTVMRDCFAPEKFFKFDRNSFVSSSFFEKEDLNYERQGICERSQNIINAASKDINPVFGAGQLSSLSLALEKADGSGIIKLQTEKLQTLESSVSDIDEVNKDHIKNRAKENALETEAENARTQLLELSALEEKCRYAEIVSEFDTLHVYESKREEQKAKIKEYRDKNSYNGFCPDKEYRREVALSFRDYDRAKKDYSDAVTAYSKYNSESAMDKVTEEILRRAESIGGTEKVMAKYETAYSSAKRLVFASLLSFTVCFFALITGLLLGILGADFIYYFGWTLGLVSTLAAGGIFMYGALGYRRTSIEMTRDFMVNDRQELQKVLQKIDDAKRSVEARQKVLENVNREFTRAKEACDRALIRYKNAIEKWGRALPFNNIDKFTYKYDEKIKTYLEGEDKLKAELEKTEGEIRSIREKLKNYNEIDARAYMVPAKRREYLDKDYDSVLSSFNSAKEKEEKIKKEKEALRNFMEDERKHGDSSKIKEEAKLLENQITALKKQKIICKKALEAINEAQNAIKKKYSAKIIRTASDMLCAENADQSTRKDLENDEKYLATFTFADTSLYTAAAFSKVRLGGEMPLFINKEKEKEGFTPLIKSLSKLCANKYQSIIFFDGEIAVQDKHSDKINVIDTGAKNE